MKLDIACGKRKVLNSIGIDIDPESDADVIATALHLPFKNERFECITSTHFVEHLFPYELEVMLAECYRVLKPGGSLLLKVDRDWSLSRLRAKDPTHKYRYSPKELRILLHHFHLKRVQKRIYRWGFSIRNKILIEAYK